MNFRRLVFVILACYFPSIVLFGAEVSTPNVLLICVDDLRPELGCYGADYAESPHIDRLAATGVQFNRHYVQVPTCGASRYAMLTGRSPASSGVTSQNNILTKRPLSDELLEGAQSLPELFRRSGYLTTLIGKVSHTADGYKAEYPQPQKPYHKDGIELPLAWDEMRTPLGPWQHGWGIMHSYAGGRHRHDFSGYRPVVEFEAEEDTDLPEGLMAHEAIRVLKDRKNDGRPFFLAVGFINPHLPFCGTKADWEAFKDAEIPDIPHPLKPATAYWHKSGEFYNYDHPHPKTNPVSEEAALQYRRAYLASVRYVDRQIGKVLAVLESLQFSENTIVVLWGDHGWHLGDFQIWGKHCVFERALHSPLIIRAPGQQQAGLKTDALAETIDIYPTLIDLCQPKFQQTNRPLDGVSLVPTMKSPGTTVRDVAISYWQDRVSIRSDQYRLIAVKPKKGGDYRKVELYDLSHGPDATENLAESHPDIVKELLKAANQRNSDPSSPQIKN
ncbi:sulfatase [Calycomorphotria hydatis]|uniref:Choline-sulfatase n=1 Tax=Calycomorphotria hydatis TaxID=2528027 RepID=A0A517TF32_9PLAN|nr:sulfatase [Calycomorphotria hydatis]QDT66982.1 Choline-sulfatase [Calycomorphotria hydatis]